MSPREKLARMRNAFVKNCSRLLPCGGGRTLALLFTAVGLGLAAPTIGYADTLNVCSSCTYTTIGAAITAAYAGDTISVDDAVHSEWDIVVDKNLTIQGHGAASTAVDGAASGNIFKVDFGVTATFRDLTIRNGGFTNYAGGIFNNLSTVIVINCVLSDNRGNNAGAILNYGALTITNSTLSHNTSESRGGGVATSGGTLTLSDSTVSNNFSYDGGGLYISFNSSATISNSTISGNTGHGLYNLGSTVVSNSTFSANSTEIQGGAVFNEGFLTVNFSTLAGNSAATAGGIYDYPGLGGVTVKNSIVGDNTNGDCGGGSLTTLGANLDTDGSCGATNFTQVTSAQLDLDPLALNPPGTTATMAIGPTSVAKDAVTDCTDAANNPVATDQRGVTRPQGSGCDIGAFELQGNPTSAIGTTIEFGPTTAETDTPAGDSVTMGAFVHDKAMVDTTVNNIPADSTATFHSYGNKTCSGTPTSSDTIAVAAGGMAASVESSGTPALSALGPLAVGAISYDAAFTSGDTGVMPNATSPCEPLDVSSPIDGFFYYLDGSTEPEYSCTFESLVNNTCTNGEEAQVSKGSTHSYVINVRVKNQAGLPIVAKLQGGLTTQGASYSGLTADCGGAAFKKGKGAAIVWNANGSSSSSASGFTMQPDAVCNLEVTVTKKFTKTGQQVITDSWSESQTETSPVTEATVTMTAPATGRLVVQVGP